MIFFDFDGTLVDLWPRYFSVFKDITGFNTLKLDEYKLAKQKYITDLTVAHYFGISLPAYYFDKKKEMIEERKYLSMDKLFFSMKELQSLLCLKPIILTKRRNIDNFYWQLSVLGIDCKASVIREDGKKDRIAARFPTEKGIIIGDSIADLEAATLSNIEAWMVGYGVQTKEQFDKTGIDYKYIETPAELLNICMKLHS